MSNFIYNSPYTSAKISAPHAHLSAVSGAEHVRQGPAHLPVQFLPPESIDRLSIFSNSRSIDQLPVVQSSAEAAQKMRLSGAVILTPQLAQSVNSFELAIRELDPEFANLLRIAFYARLEANSSNLSLPHNQSWRPTSQITENQVINAQGQVVDAGCGPQPSFHQLFRPQNGSTCPNDPKFGPSNQTASTNAGPQRNHLNFAPVGHQGEKAVLAPAFPVHHPEGSKVCGFQPQIWIQPSTAIPTTPQSTSYGFPIPNYSGKGALDVCRGDEKSITQNFGTPASNQAHRMQHGETVPEQQKFPKSVNPMQSYSQKADNDANQYAKISDIEASSEFLKRALHQIRPEPRNPTNQKSAQSDVPGQSYTQKTVYDVIPYVNDVRIPNSSEPGHPTYQTTPKDERSSMVVQPHRFPDPIQRMGQNSSYVTPTYSQITQWTGRSKPRLPTYQTTRNDATRTMRQLSERSRAPVLPQATSKQIHGSETQNPKTLSEGGHVAHQTTARDTTDASTHMTVTSDQPGSRTLTKFTPSDGLSLPMLGDSSLLALEKTKKQLVLAAQQPRLLGQPIPKDRSLASETHLPKKQVRFSLQDGPRPLQRHPGGEKPDLGQGTNVNKSQTTENSTKVTEKANKVRQSFHNDETFISKSNVGHGFCVAWIQGPKGTVVTDEPTPRQKRSNRRRKPAQLPTLVCEQLPVETQLPELPIPNGQVNIPPVEVPPQEPMTNEAPIHVADTLALTDTPAPQSPAQAPPLTAAKRKTPKKKKQVKKTRQQTKSCLPHPEIAPPLARTISLSVAVLINHTNALAHQLQVIVKQLTLPVDATPMSARISKIAHVAADHSMLLALLDLDPHDHLQQCYREALLLKQVTHGDYRSISTRILRACLDSLRLCLLDADCVSFHDKPLTRCIKRVAKLCTSFLPTLSEDLVYSRTVYNTLSDIVHSSGYILMRISQRDQQSLHFKNDNSRLAAPETGNDQIIPQNQGPCNGNQLDLEEPTMLNNPEDATDQAAAPQPSEILDQASPIVPTNPEETAEIEDPNTAESDPEELVHILMPLEELKKKMGIPIIPPVPDRILELAGLSPPPELHDVIVPDTFNSSIFLPDQPECSFTLDESSENPLNLALPPMTKTYTADPNNPTYHETIITLAHDYDVFGFQRITDLRFYICKVCATADENSISQLAIDVTQYRANGSLPQQIHSATDCSNITVFEDDSPQYCVTYDTQMEPRVVLEQMVVPLEQPSEPDVKPEGQLSTILEDPNESNFVDLCSSTDSVDSPISDPSNADGQS